MRGEGRLAAARHGPLHLLSHVQRLAVALKLWEYGLPVCLEERHGICERRGSWNAAEAEDVGLGNRLAVPGVIWRGELHQRRIFKGRGYLLDPGLRDVERESDAVVRSKA